MLATSITRQVLPAIGAAVVGLLIASPAWAAVTLPDDTVVEKVDFERHVMGILGRMGCNGGSCHGSFQGKGGFRLSLFGYDPEKDHMALSRDAAGRRINPVNPDESLVLLKAAGVVNHEGGRRFGRDSWAYQLIREWIVRGNSWTPGHGEVAQIQVSPPEYLFKGPGETGQLTVRARFANGDEENITSFCDFRIVDDAVADVTSMGEVRSVRGGDTAVIVSYRGHVIPVRMMVPVEAAPGSSYPKVPEVNYIDREVFAKLRRLNIVPSDLSSDAEFLRRVTIDAIGCLPTPDETRAFLADKDPNKRSRKIDELLAHPMHAALWATKFSDITGNNTLLLENPQQTRVKRSQMWHDWFRKRVQENMPYDQIVEGVLCATSRENMTPEAWVEQVKKIDQNIEKGFDTTYASRPTLDLFWRRQQAVTIDVWAEKTAAAFMGIRLECAQCHKHPFDRWSQADYRSYANIFAQVTLGTSPEARKAIETANKERGATQRGGNRQVVPIRELYVGTARGMLTHPDTGRSLAPRPLGGPEIKLQDSKDARVELMNYLRSPENPFFAKSFVNRIWGHYFGAGIVDPVDNFSLGNPPSNEKLLDALARDFIERKFNIRAIERAILHSRVYQLSSATNASNKHDKNNFSHSYVRPMLAEVVVDVLNSALGVAETFGNDAPPNARAIEVGSSQVQSPTLAYVLRIFGRSPRTAACDCERSMEPALPQKLFLMTDQNLLGKMQRSRIQELVKSKKTDDEVLDELFLATLTRFPTAEDRELFKEYRGSKDRAAAFTDVVWALLNTREFILNH